MLCISCLIDPVPHDPREVLRFDWQITRLLLRALDDDRLQERVPMAPVDLRLIAVGIAQQRALAGGEMAFRRAGEARVVAPGLHVLRQLGRRTKSQAIR